MVALKTSYLGLEIDSPIVVSSCPLCQSLEGLRRIEQGGAGAVVLHSLFEEQIEQESLGLHRHSTYASDSTAEALDYFPQLKGNARGPEQYLDHLRAARRALRIPVIASLNGCSAGGWVRYARMLEDAGASALELNIYNLASDPDMDALEVEQEYLELVRAVRTEVSLPLALKIGPQFSSPVNFARRLSEAGADAIVIFNRFYQPDFDLESLEVLPNLRLSDQGELRLRLRWAALMYGRIDAELAITGGVHTGEDVVKSLMAGADVAMVASALLRNGIGHLVALHAGMTRWMEEHEYPDVETMRGSMSHANNPSPGELERSNYLQVLGSYAIPSSWRLS